MWYPFSETRKMLRYYNIGLWWSFGESHPNWCRRTGDMTHARLEGYVRQPSFIGWNSGKKSSFFRNGSPLIKLAQFW